LLQADSVSFAYDDVPVVRDVSLRAASGELVGILGPNGSGKTTLLRMLAGTLRPIHGRVTLGGRDIRVLPRADIARRIAVVPQETQAAFDYTVLEIALMGRYPHLGAFELEGPADIEIAREALAATGTSSLEARPFMTLSGGEKQRVVIASALAQFGGAALGRRAGGAVVSDQTLLLDEPTASLDLGYRLEIASMLRALHGERGLTIVLSTHDLDLAAGVCETIVLLREGRVVAAGPTDRVLTPEHIRAVFDVEADIAHHPSSGRLTVVPLRTLRAAGDRGRN
jgi:iron complex transport system ATP-binding protein